MHENSNRHKYPDISRIFPNGNAAKALDKALLTPHIPVICDYSLDEAAHVAARKFPQKIKDLEVFLYKILPSVKLIKTPTEEIENESKIRDIKDRPIFRAALNEGVDAILTGDKDFLESGIKKPKMLEASGFLTT
jgi:predicted nucleic acid-binding protein